MTLIFFDHILDVFAVTKKQLESISRESDDHSLRILLFIVFYCGFLG